MRATGMDASPVQQGVRATGYVRAADGNGLLDAFVRATLRARIEDALAGRTYSGVIVARLIGDRRGRAA